MASVVGQAHCCSVVSVNNMNSVQLPTFGSSTVGAVSGLSGEGEDRRDTMRRQEERRAETTERRRGYAVGAAWDEGNMIQAMARLKNPTIAWRYGDG